MSAGTTADRALERAVAALPAGAEAAVEIERLERGLTRFAASAIHQNVAEDVWTATLTAHHDGRTVTVRAGLGREDDDGALAGLASRVAQSLALAPADPAWPGLAAPAEVDDAPDAAPMSSPAERADAVAAFVDGAGGLVTAGYVRSQRRAVWFASSTGQRAEGASSSTALDGIARAGVEGALTDGVAREMALTAAALDPRAAGSLAAAKARASADAVQIEPGRYEVLLEPAAAVDLVQSLAMWGYNGRQVADESSFVRLGEQQLDAAVSLVDDPRRWGATFDTEGTPRRAVTLVDAGRSAAVAHDLRTAAECGATSTGHATDFWPVPLHAGIVPGTGGDAVAHEGVVHGAARPLLAGVERGLLVSDFWYTRVLDPRQLTVTGLTRNGVWLVEGGEIVAPVQNVRFTQSYPQALAPGAVLGVGGTAVTAPDSWLPTAFSAPALRLASWNVTGNASG